MKKVLYIITARSGSKSIPNKNIKKIGELELLSYKIKSALKVANKEDVWLSTDSELYAEIGKKAGATIPFIRPKELSTDTTQSADVILHAMNFAQECGLKYDALCLLEPTVPFVPYDLLNQALEKLYEDKDTENVLAVKRVSPGTFFIQNDEKYLWKIAQNVRQNNGVKRRQDETPEITPSGCFYFAKWDSFLKHKSFFTNKTLAFLVDDLYCTEIDEPLDLLWSEFLVEKSLIDMSLIY